VKQRKHWAINLTGKKFGRLRVLKFSHIGSNGQYFWRCKCSCGRFTKVSTGKLRFKHTRSCGCLYREVGKRNLKDLKGKRFGKLLVLKRAKRRRGIDVCWLCRCDCGKVRAIKAVYLTQKETKSCGCGKYKHGPEHWNWDSKLTENERKFDRRLDNRARHWMKRVFNRDKFTCQITNERGGKLCAHHLAPWSKNKKMRYWLRNGVTLRQDIHILFHKLYGYSSVSREKYDEFVKRFNLGEFAKIILCHTKH
jgi:hypothetical protein